MKTDFQIQEALKIPNKTHMKNNSRWHIIAENQRQRESFESSQRKQMLYAEIKDKNYS